MYSEPADPRRPMRYLQSNAFYSFSFKVRFFCRFGKDKTNFRNVDMVSVGASVLCMGELFANIQSRLW